MQKPSLCLLAVAVLVLVASTSSQAQTTSKAHWVGIWATSAMPADGGFKVRPFSGTTLREIMHITNGGKQIRVRFTNAYGTDILTIANAHVALSAGGSDIQDGSDHSIQFGGSASVAIPPGAEVFSDPIDLAVAPLTDVAVSFFLPSQVMRSETFHDFADQDNFMATGDVAGAKSLPQPTTLTSWYFVDGIDASAIEGSRAIVTLGDSITDGALSTHNANLRWPDVLASRLQQDAHLKNVSVLNQGIGGNRVVNEGYGPSAISRVDRDVLSQTGVRYVIVLEGINDIGHLHRLQEPGDEITAQQLEFGYRQIADAAHAHGIKAIGATLTPYGGAGYSSDKGEQVREEVNDWIRNSGTFDGVIDFDKITRDAANPKAFNAAYDSGDHLHPKDDGYKAMAAGIDLSLFR